MISASGSNPLERCSQCTLILRVIRLMNDPGPKTLADPTLIMLREPHLESTRGCLANSGTKSRWKSCALRRHLNPHCYSPRVTATSWECPSPQRTFQQRLTSKVEFVERAKRCHQFKTLRTNRSLEESAFQLSSKKKLIQVLLFSVIMLQQNRSQPCCNCSLFRLCADMFKEKKAQQAKLHQSNINTLKIAHWHNGRMSKRRHTIKTSVHNRGVEEKQQHILPHKWTQPLRHYQHPHVCYVL